MAPGNSYQPVKTKNIITHKANQGTQSWSNNTRPACSGRCSGVLVGGTNPTLVPTSISPPHNNGMHSDSAANPRSHKKDHRGDQMMNYHGQKVDMTKPVPTSDPPSQNQTVLRPSERPEEEDLEEETPNPVCHRAGPVIRLQDWRVKGEKPILILGDSNINQIPPFHNTEVQADSYPGASFYHFNKLMDQTEKHTDTEVLILSVGINNRDQDAAKTSIKQLRSMFKKASSAFPHTDIRIPIINFSPLLSTEQKNNLITINKHIEQNLPFFDPLPQELFHTINDNIHWTPETAGEILSHWLTVLKNEELRWGEEASP